MNRYMLLTYGFEKPTPEIMDAWKKWFESVGPRTVETGGFHGAAREIAKDGAKDLPMDLDAITGYLIVEAESFEKAVEMAEGNPFVSSIRIYEIVQPNG